MLKFFEVEKTFYKFRASLYVDLGLREPQASLMLIYDRRIVRHGDLPASTAYHLRTPEAAEDWFSEVVGERGSRVESWEREFRLAAEASTRKAA